MVVAVPRDRRESDRKPRARLEAEGSRDLRLGPVVIGSECACHRQQGYAGGHDAAQVTPHDGVSDASARLPSRRSCRLCTNT